MRLVCLPFAGGGSAIYHRWRPAVPAWIDLMPIALPGHDGRLREQTLTDLRALAILMADELQSVLHTPFVFLGHSIGAWLAFELTRELRRRRARSPELLVVSASRAPHLPLTESPIHHLSDDELLLALERRYGGIAPEVSESPELLRLLLPALRADLRMAETYRYTEEPPLETEIFALGGTEDAAVSSAQLNAWQRQTTRPFSPRLVPGDHFFLFGGNRQIVASGKPNRSAAPTAALHTIITRIQQCRTRLLADRKEAK